jgi:hypothetical protein
MENKPFDDMAAELLKFIDNPLERFDDAEHQRAYQLQRTRTFLEMKFGHVSALQKEVESLRKEKEMWRPVITAWSERQKSPDENQF